MVVGGPGKVELVYSPSDGRSPVALEVFSFEGKSATGGVALSMYNTLEVNYHLKILFCFSFLIIFFSQLLVLHKVVLNMHC